MNEESLNLQIRKFLKKVGITSQRELEQAIRAAVQDGRHKPGDEVEVRISLGCESLGINTRISDRIRIE